MNSRQCWSFFQVPIDLSVCSLWRTVYLNLPIFDFLLLLLSCMRCSCILEIKPLSVTLFANIFSQSVGCHFVLFMVSFAMPKLISLTRSHLFMFDFNFLIFLKSL